MGRKAKNYIGLEVNGLYILELDNPHISPNNRNKYIKVLVLCPCGNIFSCFCFCILKGHTKSCGCKYFMDRHTLDPLFSTWINMINRCYYEKSISYKYYGGRGIKVCIKWRKDFFSFRDWALKNGWKRGLRVDRKDNYGNYTPQNCRIVTQKENMQNLRINQQKN
jgi:hypothetical protein